MSSLSISYKITILWLYWIVFKLFFFVWKSKPRIGCYISNISWGKLTFSCFNRNSDDLFFKITFFLCLLRFVLWHNCKLILIIPAHLPLFCNILSCKRKVTVFSNKILMNYHLLSLWEMFLFAAKGSYRFAPFEN